MLQNRVEQCWTCGYHIDSNHTQRVIGEVTLLTLLWSWVAFEHNITKQWILNHWTLRPQSDPKTVKLIQKAPQGSEVAKELNGVALQVDQTYPDSKMHGFHQRLHFYVWKPLWSHISSWHRRTTGFWTPRHDCISERLLWWDRFNLCSQGINALHQKASFIWAAAITATRKTRSFGPFQNEDVLLLELSPTVTQKKKDPAGSRSYGAFLLK